MRPQPHTEGVRGSSQLGSSGHRGRASPLVRLAALSEASGDLLPAVERLAGDPDQRGDVIEGDACICRAGEQIDYGLRVNCYAVIEVAAFPA